MNKQQKVEPRPGYNADYDFESKSGAVPSIQVNVVRKLTKDRLLVVLRRLRERVASVDLTGYDDTTLGDKNTECAWGLCSDSPELWPDAKDHTFPYDFLNRGRVSSLGYKGACPLQMEEGNGSGCFYYCRFFQASQYRSVWPALDRDSMLERIDAKIRELEKNEESD
jgi:hypothetical protein